MASHNPAPGMAKLTVDIDSELRRRLKRTAADKGQKMQDVVIRGIELALAELEHDEAGR